MSRRIAMTPNTLQQHLDTDVEADTEQAGKLPAHENVANDNQDNEEEYEASSVYSTPDPQAELQTWFKLQSKTELNAPKLITATSEQYKQFVAKFQRYKEEENGIQSMVALISIKARTTLCLLVNLSPKLFLQLSDDECQQKLNIYQ